MKQVEIQDNPDFGDLKDLLGYGTDRVLKAIWVFPLNDNDVQTFKKYLADESNTHEFELRLGEWNLVIYYEYDSNCIGWHGQHGCNSYRKADIVEMLRAIESLIPEEAPLEKLVKRLNNV